MKGQILESLILLLLEHSLLIPATFWRQLVNHRLVLIWLAFVLLEVRQVCTRVDQTRSRSHLHDLDVGSARLTVEHPEKWALVNSDSLKYSGARRPDYGRDPLLSRAEVSRGEGVEDVLEVLHVSKLTGLGDAQAMSESLPSVVFGGVNGRPNEAAIDEEAGDGRPGPTLAGVAVHDDDVSVVL